jgi:FRG domain
MPDVDVFLDVYFDLRFPLIALDLEKLRRAMQRRERNELVTHFGVELAGSPARRRALVSALRGLFRKIDMPPHGVDFIARLETIESAGLSQNIEALKSVRARCAVYEHGDMLIWEEETPWPVAYSTLLQQFVGVMTLHRMLMENRIKEVERQHTEAGWAVENIAGITSEFPRQLPTHLHYAMASLGAWLGGAMNLQYFSYYAAIRQIYHPDLNLKYAKKIGFSESDAAALNASGIVALPAPLFVSLIEAQGSNLVFGSIQIDEFNLANPPPPAFDETRDWDDKRTLPGFVIDKYYRAAFRARTPGGYAFYGTKNVLRDHYEEFYAGLPAHALVRCKHYCVPVVDVATIDELSSHIAKIPLRSKDGLFFRGQRQLYPLPRHEMVRDLLYGRSCSKEPSLITAASREAGYDYDKVHFALKTFLEEEVLRRADAGESELLESWRREAVDPMCRLDSAVLALAQHYGIPSHGLDVTTSVDVALWFATNRYSRDDSGISKYAALKPEDWPQESDKWPVVIACQTVTQSIEQSLHDCDTLEQFGFDARRPQAQSAQFFQGGHSDHQNRLAEAVMCIFRLAPGVYSVKSRFESLFPPPEDDPAYRVMLRFAGSPLFGPEWGRFVNRFH